MQEEAGKRVLQARGNGDHSLKPLTEVFNK